MLPYRSAIPLSYLPTKEARKHALPKVVQQCPQQHPSSEIKPGTVQVFVSKPRDTQIPAPLQPALHPCSQLCSPESSPAPLQPALHPYSQPCLLKPILSLCSKQGCEAEEGGGTDSNSNTRNSKPCLSDRAPIQRSPNCMLLFIHNSQKM